MKYIGTYNTTYASYFETYGIVIGFELNVTHFSNLPMYIVYDVPLLWSAAH